MWIFYLARLPVDDEWTVGVVQVCHFRWRNVLILLKLKVSHCGGLLQVDRSSFNQKSSIGDFCTLQNDGHGSNPTNFQEGLAASTSRFTVEPFHGSKF